MDLFIGLASLSQGHHFDIFMDNVDMVYMDIMICWNIIMVMCIYFGRYDNVTQVRFCSQRRLRIGPIQRMRAAPGVIHTGRFVVLIPL